LSVQSDIIMEVLRHSKLFKLTGLTIWSFALMTNVSIIADQIEIDVADNSVETSVIHGLQSVESIDYNLYVEPTTIVSLKFPSLPEQPPSPDQPKIRYYYLIIERASLRYNLDPDLIRAMIMVESRYKSKGSSAKHAKGLMQITPSTAAELGVKDIYDPEDNIFAGAKYLRYLLGRTEGDVELALAAYNAGFRKVLKHGGVPPFPETQSYVENVFKYYSYYKIESLRNGRIILE
jgi:hypothetical protein